MRYLLLLSLFATGCSGLPSNYDGMTMADKLNRIHYERQLRLEENTAKMRAEDPEYMARLDAAAANETSPEEVTVRVILENRAK